MEENHTRRKMEREKLESGKCSRWFKSQHLLLNMLPFISSGDTVCWQNLLPCNLRTFIIPNLSAEVSPIPSIPHTGERHLYAIWISQLCSTQVISASPEVNEEEGRIQYPGPSFLPQTQAIRKKESLKNQREEQKFPLPPTSIKNEYDYYSKSDLPYLLNFSS